MKKILSVLMALTLLLTATACGSAVDPEPEESRNSGESNIRETSTGETNIGEINIEETNIGEINIEESGIEVIMGKVTAIDGNTVTLAIISQENGKSESFDQPGGAVTEIQPSEPLGQEGQQGAVPPDKPGGSSELQQDGTITEGGQGTVPPDKPDGNSEPQQGGTIAKGRQGTVPPDKPEEGFDLQTGFQNVPTGIMLTGETRTIEITDTSVLYKKESETETPASLTDISVNSVLTVTYNEKSQITKILITSESDFPVNDGGQTSPDGNGGGKTPPGGKTSDVIYGGATEITSAAEETGKAYASETADQSALLISTSDDVAIYNPSVSKTGDSDGGDNCNFYGQNAAVLVKGGSVTTVTGGTVTSDATGANGVFSYGGNGGSNGAAGDGTTVIISDTVITTTGNGSGGIMTTGGGITRANNLTVTTSGQSSAAIRTDRGGGTVTVAGGTYTTNGLGSPSVYSTADITVTDAELVSNLSEGVCIEGLNSIELNNTSLTANNTRCNGNATFYDTIMIYQSMSGDAASGTSSFTMNGGSLTSKNGHVFHVTNTSAVITLNGVTITNEDSGNVLLSVCDDGWSGGSNTAVLNADSQVLNGGILVGDNSSLTMTLSENSVFTGYINGNITNAAGKTVSKTVGTVSVTLTGGSTWILTGDSYITDFSGDASAVISNGYTLYVNGTALTGTK